jgi:hypothetical protein
MRGAGRVRAARDARPLAGRRLTRSRRHVLLALVATLLALTGTLAPSGATIARAAGDSLQITTAATYTIVPARRVVAVVLDVTARNNKPNVTSGGIVTKYFYDTGRIAIQTEARNVHATSDGVRVAATTKPADGYLTLEVHFRSSLFFHQTGHVRVTFDLPGGAPRSKSDIRVGTAFATFVAWAFGDGGSVRVVVPAGFSAESSGSDAVKSTSGGATIFRATGITDVPSWYLVVNADRESALTDTRIDLAGGEHLLVRAWPEDTVWKRQVSDLLTQGLPRLAGQIGLPWPVTGDLSVFEVHTPLLEGYAGVFLQGEDKIEISEDLDDLTILHESAHAWFNSDLFVGRWINEGLADTFASRTLDGMGEGGWAPDPVSPTDKAAVRLDAWTFPGRIADTETDAREQYGYNAAWTVIRSIVIEVGGTGMQAVLKAAQDHQIAYTGGGTPETVNGNNDWRRLLDLLDEVGKSTRSDDEFRRFVATDAEAVELDARAAARTAYAALATADGDWSTPFYVRGPMSDWNFPVATTRIAEATALLGRRDAIAAIVAPLGVTPPVDLQTSYQAARDSLDDANRIAAEETAAAQDLATATTAVDAPRAPLVALGLLGTTPELDLAAARSAFSAGAADAGARALAVTALIDGSVEVGRGRLVAAVVGLAVALILLILAILLLRHRRRRRRALLAAAASSGGESSGAAIAGSWAAWAPGGPGLVADPPAAGTPVAGTPAAGTPAAETSAPDPASQPPYATLADQSSSPPHPDRTAEPAVSSETVTATDDDASEPPPTAPGDAP